MLPLPASINLVHRRFMLPMAAYTTAEGKLRAVRRKRSNYAFLVSRLAVADLFSWARMRRLTSDQRKKSHIFRHGDLFGTSSTLMRSSTFAARAAWRTYLQPLRPLSSGTTKNLRPEGSRFQAALMGPRCAASVAAAPPRAIDALPHKHLAVANPGQDFDTKCSWFVLRLEHRLRAHL